MSTSGSPAASAAGDAAIGVAPGTLDGASDVPAVLRVRELDAWIGVQQILHQVSFDMPAQGVTALLGRNGVGKTTTLRALLGLVRRTGLVELAGTPVQHEPTHRIVRRGVGYVPENREVFGGLTVAENLSLARRRRRRTGRAAAAGPRDASGERLVNELFPLLAERGDQLAGTLSGGQQQMVALARALLNDNRVLLVDEPTKGLAPQVVDEVAAALAAAAARVPILLVEQDLAVVSQIADRVVVLAEGRVVHTGSADQFLADRAAVARLLGVSA